MANESKSSNKGSEVKEGVTFRKLLEGTDIYLPSQEVTDFDFDEIEISENADSNDEANPLPVIGLESINSSLTRITDDGKLMKFMVREGTGSQAEKGFVSVHYVSYANECSVPFDSSHNRDIRPLVFQIGKGYAYDGFEMAVKTMKPGELACFLIHPDLAFKELGAPPRIPPNASIYVIIELVKIELVQELGETEGFTDKRSFEEIGSRVKALIKQGNDTYRSKQIMAAMKIYRKAERLLFSCKLQNDLEEAMWKKLLMKVFLNLTVCFNNESSPSPKMVCSIAQEAFSTIPELAFRNAKFLFQLGKAQFSFNPAKSEKWFQRVINLKGEVSLAEQYLKEIEKQRAAVELDDSNVKFER